VKTIAISFHQPQKVHFECPSIKIYDTVIKYSEQLKFLRVWLDKNLSWSIHIQARAKKLCKICFGLRLVKRVLGLETVRTLYYAYFLPLLLQIPKTTSCKQYFKYLQILPFFFFFLFGGVGLNPH
jgi:hypothetical protein